MSEKTSNSTKTIGYINVSHGLFEFILVTSLPWYAVKLVMLVLRYSHGYHQKSVFLDMKLLRSVLGCNKQLIAPCINGLIKLNILQGGPVKRGKDGRIFTFELSLNPALGTWEVPMPAKRRTDLYGLGDQIKILKGYQYEQNKSKQKEPELF